MSDGPRQLRRGDVVEVKSAAEIAATLDERGTLEGMPFMPEMVRFAGLRFTVGQRADIACDTSHRTGSRRVPDAVFLEDLRCDGIAHGGCQAECRLFWKESWLRRAPHGSVANGGSDALMSLTTEAARRPDDPAAWRCQATELHASSIHLRTFDPRHWVRELRTGNVPFLRLARVFVRAMLIEGRLKLGLLSPVHLRGRHRSTPPMRSLDLRPGDLVEVKSPADIAEFLTVDGMNRGLWFDREMLPYCGRRFRVRQRIRRFLDERTGRMVELKTDCVTLEGVICAGEHSTARWLCARAIYPFWRESWLRRVGDEHAGERPGRAS